MKLNWIVGGAIALSLASCGGEKSEDKKTDNAKVEVADANNEVASPILGGGFETEMQTVSYALGFNIADSFLKQNVTQLSGDQLEKGYKDFLADAASVNVNESMQLFQSFMMKHQTAMRDTTVVATYNQSYMDSVSYAFGINLAQNYQQMGIEGLEVGLMNQAFKDLNAGNPKMKEEETLNVLQAFGQKQQAIQAEKSKAKYANVLKSGQDFLAENAKRPEVTTLPSGLQNVVIKEGNGAIPTMMDKVSTHYEGTLIDGTVFDSSIKKGAPIEFGVGGVIKGWTEALKLMPVGSKWKLYIPYDLAYGERGSGAKIPPYSTLIFDIELLDIVK